jgi:hypothetical protein
MQLAPEKDASMWNPTNQTIPSAISNNKPKIHSAKGKELWISMLPYRVQWSQRHLRVHFVVSASA